MSFNMFGTSNGGMIIRQRLSQYNPMDEVAIVSDTLNYGFPLGEKAYILGVNPDASVAFNYLVRVPSKQQQWYVPECDIMSWTQYLQKSVDNAIHKHYVDAALEHGNEDMFNNHAKEIDE